MSTTTTETSSRPLVTVGLPVFNGIPHVETAIRSLLEQDYPNFELLVSDNASHDGTQDMCRQLLGGRDQAHYHRNPENVGPFRNYLGLLERAHGKYFMWASHDDKWDPHFITALVERLEESPQAVLATPAVLHVQENGMLRPEAPDRPSPGGSSTENLRIMFEDHAASWVYGLYRTQWLREHVEEWNTYPLWGSDVMWLTEICLRYQVTGNQDAIMYKRLRRSGYAPKNARAVVAFWAYMYWHFSRIIARHTRGRERARLLLLSWRYLYRLCIRRPGMLRTAWRVTRMLSIASITTIPVALMGWLGLPIPGARRLRPVGNVRSLPKHKRRRAA